VASEKKLINVKHMKFGMLSAVLVVCTLMISTIDLSQNFVFAQNTTSTLLPSQLPAQDSTSTPITPTPNTSDNDDDSSSSDDNNSNNDESSSSSGSADDDNNSEDSDGDSSGSEDATSSEEEETEDDFEQTNPLLEQIRESVSGALSATGMAVP
jgi:cytoskeletal protein RodZ